MHTRPCGTGLTGLSGWAIGLVLAAWVAPAQLTQATTIRADILWLVDTSGSMYENNKLPALQSRLGRFNEAMVANGIDAHYGLVIFRGTEALLQNPTDFDTFTAVGSAFNTLEPLAGGGAHPERGSDAIRIGLEQATFRPGSVVNLILFSDEDDQSAAETFAAADRLLSERGALFNAIADPRFTHTSTGLGNVVERYGTLAAEHGGALFDLREFLDLRTADDFFADFTAAKVQEIRSAVPDAGSTLALLLLTLPALRLFNHRSSIIRLRIAADTASRAALASDGAQRSSGVVPGWNDQPPCPENDARADH